MVGCEQHPSNGFAEELMMRGFVFRHCREGRSFWCAATLSTIYFAAYHLPLIFTEGAIIGITGVVVSIPIGFLTAYIYERGKNTIWGPVLLHVVNNVLVMVLTLPSNIQASTSLLYLLIGIDHVGAGVPRRL